MSIARRGRGFEGGSVFRTVFLRRFVLRWLKKAISQVVIVQMDGLMLCWSSWCWRSYVCLGLVAILTWWRNSPMSLRVQFEFFP